MSYPSSFMTWIHQQLISNIWSPITSYTMIFVQLLFYISALSLSPLCIFFFTKTYWFQIFFPVFRLFLSISLSPSGIHYVTQIKNITDRESKPAWLYFPKSFFHVTLSGKIYIYDNYIFCFIKQIIKKAIKFNKATDNKALSVQQKALLYSCWTTSTFPNWQQIIW